MINSAQKDRVIAVLTKYGLKEQTMAKGLYIGEGNIAADLRGKEPKIGVWIGNEVQTEKHGVLRVQDIVNEVAAAMKFKSSTATCEDCGCTIFATLEKFKKVDEQFGGIYCMDCQKKQSTKNNHEAKVNKDDNKVATPEASTDQKVAGNVPATPTKSDIKASIIKTCSVCGLELSGARALECFEKDPQKPRMICEGCENNHDEAKHQETQKGKDEATQERKTRPEESKGVTNMDEKLPEVIKGTENKLTVNTIKQYICPTATEAEAYNFLQLCLHRDLNPFLKEAYLIKYGTQPATMVVGKDAFTRKAEESGKLDGYEAGIIVMNKDKQIERRVGVVQFEGDVLVGGWAKVYRKDMKYPFVTEVPLNEYIKRKPDGTPQSSWGIMPGTMIRKVALVQDLREAFTKELGGCYDAVEMGAQDNLK